MLKFHDTCPEKYYVPRRGVWSMENKKFVNRGVVANWTCIIFESNVSNATIRSFLCKLASMCKTCGMEFNDDPVLPPAYAGFRNVDLKFVLENHLSLAMEKLPPHRTDLDLIIFIPPNNNGSLYGDLKRICETDLGIVSQCCLTKKVTTPSDLYLENLALKINVKVGGINTVLKNIAIPRKLTNVIDGKPTIIFGSDVTHWHSGNSKISSIAAVVASQDWPAITKYAGLVCAQEHHQEIIQGLYTSGPKGHGGMIREHLLSFYKANNKLKPEHIIFYRDGIIESRFEEVLLHEVSAIREACKSIETDYQPPITFVVVQKRHHTRLFASDNSTDNSGNILPGTVVDSKICHPTRFDFYLCSHHGQMGMSRPASYHVLFDENQFGADALQQLTYNLCYTYARCTRSLSIVPPTHYAHLAAFRARFYMEPDTSYSGSTTIVRALPALKDKANNQGGAAGANFEVRNEATHDFLSLIKEWPNLCNQFGLLDHHVMKKQIQNQKNVILRRMKTTVIRLMVNLK